MLRTGLILILMGLFAATGMAQANLNEYKYVIIPKRFDAFGKSNMHQTSTVLKHLFTQKGFQAIYEDELPDDLANNPCLGLTADILDESNMFTTKTGINLADCKGQLVFSTPQGISKEKEFKRAYANALGKAMGIFDGMAYAYKEKEVPQEPMTIKFQNDVKKIEDRAPQLKQAKNLDSLVTQKATPEEQLYKDRKPVASSVQKAPEEQLKKLDIKKPNPDDIWYAQAVGTGFQLVDSTPQIRMNLAKSSVDGVYFAKAGNKNGIAFKKDGVWYFEHYEGDTLVQEELKLKF
jgi:hypothetical protein